MMKTINLNLLMVLCCAFANNVLAQNLSLSTDLNRNFSPATLNVTLIPDGFKQFEYVQATSTATGIFSKVKIPFSADSKYSAFNFENEAVDSIEIVFKDFDGTINWNKIELRIDEYVDKPIIIGNYIATAVTMQDGWQKVTIPIYDNNFQSVSLTNVRYIQFPLSRDAGQLNLGIKGINLKGPKRNIEWLGTEKFDNSISSSNGMSYQLVLTNDSPTRIVKTGLVELVSGLSQTLEEMPFLHYQKSLAKGQKRYFGFVVDDAGNTIYSDTMSFDINPGLVYTKSDISCAGAADGSIVVEMLGGEPPFSFDWNNGLQGAEVNGLEKGFYDVTVTDAVGQKDSAVVEITEAAQLIARVLPLDCQSASNYMYRVTGGVAPYSVKYSNVNYELIEGTETKMLAHFSPPNPYELTLSGVESFDDNSMIITGASVGGLSINDSIFSSEGNQYIAKMSRNGTIEWSYILKEGIISDILIGENDSVYISYSSIGEHISIISDQGIINVGPTGNNLAVFSKEGLLSRFVQTQSSNLLDIKIDLWNHFVLVDAVESGAILRKIDLTGNTIWQRHLSGQLYNYPNNGIEIAINEFNELALIVNYAGELSIDGQSISGENNTKVKVMKFSSDGLIQWAKDIGDIGKRNYGYQIAFDSDEALIITATFEDALNVIKIGANTGNIMWNTPFTSKSTAGYSFAGNSELKVAKNDHVYISGLSYQKNLLFGSEESQLRDYLIELSGDGTYISNRNIFNYPYDFDSKLPFSITSDGYLLYYSPDAQLIKEGPVSSFSIDLGAENFLIKDAMGCVLEQVVQVPTLEQTEICYVSIENNYPELHINNLPDSVILEIYREGSAVNDYTLISSEGPVSGSVVYADTTVSTINRSYRYKVQLRDYCGIQSELSDFHQTIHLMLSEGISDKHVNLQWNQYIGRAYDAINIYKGSSSEAMSLVATLPANLYTYTDTDASTSDVLYMIEAVGIKSCTPSMGGRFAGGQGADGKIKITSNIARRTLVSGNSLVAYPNPVRVGEQLYFGQSEAVTIHASDIKGQELFTKRINAFEGLDTSPILPGIYMIYYQLNGQIIHHKILVID